MAYAVLSCALLGYAAPSSAQMFRPLPPASGQEPGAPPAAAPSAEAPLPAPAAQAPAATPQPSDEAREKARQAYARGQALFGEAKYAEAEVAFTEAYTAVPNPVVLLGKAECEARLGKLEDAYATFQQYLKERPDAPDRADVEKKVAELAALPATLSLSSEPAGAAIRLDGQDTGKVTPTDLTVPRGTHRIELVLAGYDTASEELEARIGARHELQIGLRKTAPKPPAAAEAPQPAAAAPPKAPAVPQGPPTTALWITGIVGATGLITGTVLGFMVLAQRSDYDAKPTESRAKRGERLALFTDVAFGMGAMALVTCAVLYLTSDRVEAPPPSAPAASWKLAPAVLAHGGAGVFAQGRF